jgi:hypothetical protein
MTLCAYITYCCIKITVCFMSKEMKKRSCTVDRFIRLRTVSNDRFLWTLKCNFGFHTWRKISLPTEWLLSPEDSIPRIYKLFLVRLRKTTKTSVNLLAQNRTWDLLKENVIHWTSSSLPLPFCPPHILHNLMLYQSHGLFHVKGEGSELSTRGKTPVFNRMCPLFGTWKGILQSQLLLP